MGPTSKGRGKDWMGRGRGREGTGKGGEGEGGDGKGGRGTRPHPFTPPPLIHISGYAPVCARLLKNACMDLDEMLRVDRCRDTDELINF